MSKERMGSERLHGIDVISGIAAGAPGAGDIDGYRKNGFPFLHASQAMEDMLGFGDEDDLVAGMMQHGRIHGGAIRS